MSKSKQITQVLLNAANEAYEMGEGRINEELEHGERCDTLAEFIAVEIAEVIEGEEDFESARQVAINAMEKALSEIQDVINALETAEETSNE